MNDLPVEQLPEAPPRERVLLPRPVAVAIIGTFLILLIGALYYGRAFFLPLILAVLISLSIMPVVRYLGRRGLPAPLSAVLLVFGIGIVATGAAIVLAAPVAKLVTQAPEIAGQLRDRFSFINRPLALLVEAGQQLQGLAEPAGQAAPKVTLAEPGILSWAADALTGIGGTIGATLIFVIFLLSSGDVFLQKIVRAVSSLSDKKRSLRIVHDVEAEVSRYLLTVTVINFAFGVCLGILMTILGMPNPLGWGVAGALLNYVPYVGPIIGVLLATAVAMITFPDFPADALPSLGYIGLHLVESWFLTPLILGRRLELNSVAILIALAFGGWMWGIVGAIIAVPLLVVVKAFCDHFPSLATFGDFLSGEAPLVEHNGKPEGVTAEARPVMGGEAGAVKAPRSA